MNGKEVLFNAFVTLVCGFVVGMGITSEVWKQRAIEKGYAEYVVVNEKTGAVEFVWKDEVEENLNQEEEKGE